jgi:PAS domain S-box-containing protein/putative nucleotidyltransferase with HDIG domain
VDLRILFVEDSTDDVALMLRRLREAGIEPQWDRVQTEAALREALAGERWELALVDYNLPGFGGSQALAVLAAEAPDVPAITVSGAITEETAVTTIKAGAVDYVLKDNLTRLAPAVQRAVEGAELRRRERRAAEQARQTMYAIEHSSQAVFYIGEDGSVLYLNEAAQRLWGVPRVEAVGQSIWGWSPDVDEQRFRELWYEALRSPVVDFEGTLSRADGERRLISATLDHHAREEGSFVIVYARDITEQREVEERARASEERYARLADNASDIIFRYDLLPVMGLTYVNPAVEATTGYTPDECYADPQLMFTMVHPDDAAEMAALMRSLSPPDQPVLMRWIGKDGITRWMESRLVPVRDSAGQLLAVEGITRDVTERKRAEEELRFTRFVVEQAGDPVFWMTADGALTYANPATCAILGYSLDELRRMTIHDIDPDFPATRWPEHMKELEQAGSLTFETHHRTKSGTLIPMEITANYLEYDGDVYDVAFARDIRQRKQAEDELAQSHDLLSNLTRLVPGVVYQYRLYPDGRSAFPYSSPGMNDIYEVTPEEVREDATTVFGRLHPDDADRVGDLIQESARTLEEFYCEFRVILPRQGLRWRWSQAHPERTEDGGTLWHGIISDITERKLAEDEIRRQAEQLRRTVEGAVLAMSNVVETRDPYTAGHERRVAELAAAIAAEMGMDGEAREGLRLAGLIHDVGKIAVPAEILARPGRLSEVEFNLIKQHPASGSEILAAIDFGLPVAEMVLQHHERLDGSGYPGGLVGEEILPEARILAVADVVEAMSSHRPYRAALGMDAALAEIREHAGVKYDAAVVAACVRLVEEQGFAFTP